MADPALRYQGRVFKTCEQCKGEFYRKPHRMEAGRFCGRECSFAHKRKASEDRVARLASEKSALPATAYDKTCCHCGTAFISMSPAAKYCCKPCSGAASRGRSKFAVYMRDRYRKERQLTAKNVRCQECGNAFKAYRTKATFCSVACCDRNHDRMRSIRKRTTARPLENINPVDVFNAAGWMCQECGIETPKEKRGRHRPDSPEIDHVMPLARGGTHTRGNVQCLCRSCNMKKGVKIPEVA